MRERTEPKPELARLYDEDTRRVLRYAAPLVAVLLVAEGISHLILSPEQVASQPEFVLVAVLGALPTAFLGWLARQPPASWAPPERYWPLLPWAICFGVLVLHMGPYDPYSTAFLIASLMFGCAAFIIAPVPLAISLGSLWLVLLWWLITRLPGTLLVFGLFSLLISVGVHVARRRTLLLVEQQRTLERELGRRREEAERYHRLLAITRGLSEHFSGVLSGVVNGTSLALEQLPTDHPARPAVASALRSGEAGARLLDRLGGTRLDRRDEHRGFPASELVEEDSLRGRVAPPGRLECRLEPGLPTIEGDAQRLRDAIDELVRNAAEALPADGGVVRVEVLHDPSADLVQVHVIDSGGGLDETVRAHMFEPFWTSRGDHRSGLGLSFVLGVVTRHGGTIDVESQPGVGTRFRLFLPVQAC